LIESRWTFKRFCSGLQFAFVSRYSSIDGSGSVPSGVSSDSASRLSV
jgi:hypothetical protein